MQDCLARAAANLPAAVKHAGTCDVVDAAARGGASSDSGSSAAGSRGDGLQVCGSPSCVCAAQSGQQLPLLGQDRDEEDPWATGHAAAAGAQEGGSCGGPARLSSSISQSAQTPCARGQHEQLEDGREQQQQ